MADSATRLDLLEPTNIVFTAKLDIAAEQVFVFSCFIIFSAIEEPDRNIFAFLNDTLNTLNFFRSTVPYFLVFINTCKITNSIRKAERNTLNSRESALDRFLTRKVIIRDRYKLI